MGGSVEGLLDSCPRAGRGGDNAAVVTCNSMASSNFISAAVLDISMASSNFISAACLISHERWRL